jgi:uncharacterized protein YjbI with pentapeptide repeats
MEAAEERTCQVEMYDPYAEYRDVGMLLPVEDSAVGGKLCGRPLYDGEKCICHSEKENKEVRLFQQELDKIFGDDAGEYYDLTRFVFPQNGYILPRKYKKDTYFDYSEFSREADFGQAVFSHKVFFREVRFSKKAKFLSAMFAGATDFGNAIFSEEAYFLGATFSEKARFHSAAFFGKADFRRSTFLDAAETDFGSATFSGDAEFFETTFSNKADFSKVAFQGKTDFRWATFQRKALYHSSRFENSVDFSGCEIGKEAIVSFDGGEHPKENREMFAAEANFVSCTFAASGHIKFRKVSLENCRFLETDLTEVQFVDVTWARTPKFLKWFPRNAVYDEVSIHDNWFKWLRSKIKQQEHNTPDPQYKLIAEPYRRLQANYINNYRYAEAGDFHIGEQEMVRKAKGKIGQYLSTNFLYKIISYYGESFLLPLFWLIVALLGFSLWLLCEMDYDLSWSGSFFLFNGDYWNAFLRNLSFVTFNRAGISQILTQPYQHGIVAIENIVVVVLVTFFVLALRRRYKRKGF